MKSLCGSFVLFLIPAALDLPVEKRSEVMTARDTVVVDFAASQSGSWQVVNDGVMGGRSQSALRDSGEGTAVFSGVVSLDNNGGFASVRKSLGELDLSDYSALVVRVLGDGNRYFLRLRTDDGYDGVAYQATFETAGEDWQVVEMPFASFRPMYRGRIVQDAPPLDTGSISQIAFMIADKQEGAFRLEIAWVHARDKTEGT